MNGTQDVSMQIGNLIFWRQVLKNVKYRIKMPWGIALAPHTVFTGVIPVVRNKS